MEPEYTNTGDYRQSGTDPNSWDNQSSDPDLSEILDQVIDFVPENALQGKHSKKTKIKKVVIFVIYLEN